MPIDPSVAEAVNEIDDEEPEDDEEADEPEAAAAPTEPVPPPAPAPKKPGRPAGSRNRPKAPGTGFAEARLPGTPTPAIEALPTPAKGRPPLDKTMQQTWDDLVDELRQTGYEPSNVTIAVRRFPEGPQRGTAQDLNPIAGELVGGASNLTPGEELHDHLARYYHIPLNAGPSRYRLWFYLRGFAARQKSHLGTADIHLPSAVDVRRMLAMQDEARREKERTAYDESLPPRAVGHAPRGPHPDDPPYLGEGPMGGYIPPRPQAYPQPQPVVMPPPAAPAMDPMMKPLFEAWQAQAIAAIQRGMQPPPMPQSPVQPQGVTKEDVAQIVVETLRATGLIGGAPAQPLTPERVQESVASPMSAAKQFFAQFREFKQMEREMEDMFGPDEPEPAAAAPIPVVATVIAKPDAPDTEYELKPVGGAIAQQFMGAPVLFAPQKPDETTFQWLMRLAGGNPIIAQRMMGKAAEMGMQIIDKAGLAKLVGAIVSNAIPGGPPQAQGQVVEAPQQQQQSNGAAFKPSFS